MREGGASRFHTIYKCIDERRGKGEGEKSE